MPDYITSGFHQDSDLLDRRKHCFSVQSESGEDLYFSVELESDLTLWEKAFQTATFLEVERIQVRTTALIINFSCINKLGLYDIMMQFKKFSDLPQLSNYYFFNVCNCIKTFLVFPNSLECNIQKRSPQIQPLSCYD